jgi:hypothetical protein
MSSEMNGSKTQIIVAVIALIGVIGGALITNWDKRKCRGKRLSVQLFPGLLLGNSLF